MRSCQVLSFVHSTLSMTFFSLFFISESLIFHKPRGTFEYFSAFNPQAFFLTCFSVFPFPLTSSCFHKNCLRISVFYIVFVLLAYNWKQISGSPLVLHYSCLFYCFSLSVYSCPQDYWQNIFIFIDTLSNYYVKCIDWMNCLYNRYSFRCILKQ